MQVTAGEVSGTTVSVAESCVAGIENKGLNSESGVETAGVAHQSTPRASSHRRTVGVQKAFVKSMSRESTVLICTAFVAGTQWLLG